MRRSLFITIVFYVVLYVPPASAQYAGGNSSSWRARRSFERALDAYRLYDFEYALEEARLAVRRDPEFLSAHILKAEALFTLERFHESADAYLNVIRINPDAYPEAHYYRGVSLLKTGTYDKALEHFEAYITRSDAISSIVEQANSAIVTCRFAIEAVRDPVTFNPVNLGPGINTKDAEYSPAITADGLTMVFTRRSPRTDDVFVDFGPEVENFFVSHFKGGRWTDAVDIGRPINTPGNEGAQSLSSDGRDLYFTACNRPDGFGSCDIYHSKRTGNSWSAPVNIGSAVNSAYWDSQPSLSSDGNTLYFASARPGGHGAMDIWMSELDENGRWQRPNNLGPKINTSGREMSPFIHPDNNTLYFASDGHPGMGGLDLFVSRRDDQGNWTSPVNLGYPINTFADEFSLVVEASGRMAYYASDHDSGYGDMDIYAFELHEDARPKPMTYMKGRVFDADTGKALRATFELIDLEDETTLQTSESDPYEGDFLVVVPTFSTIALNVTSPGYLFFSDHLNYSEARTVADPYLEDIALQPIRSGESVVLRNVFFDTGSHELDPISRTELSRLAALLMQNPGIHIEISGHTDNVGTYQYNKILSENRAKAVVKYLEGIGVDARRMTYSGYADTRPVDTNDTEEGRARNRRTEFTVTDP